MCASVSPVSSAAPVAAAATIVAVAGRRPEDDPILVCCGRMEDTPRWIGREDDRELFESKRDLRPSKNRYDPRPIAVQKNLPAAAAM